MPDNPSAYGSAVRLLAVQADRAGQRLDNFLLGQLKGAPKSLIYKIIRSGQVRLNGRRAKPETRLIAEDVVRVPPVSVPAAENPAPGKRLLELMSASIVFEDTRLLAINKPSGIASHGGSGVRAGAIETLRALRPNLSLELVHRLDRDTSGLLIIAKKRSALTGLQALLREEHGNGIEKRYLALLCGRMPDGVMRVDAPLHIGLRQGGERHVQVRNDGKPALSEFKVLERRGGQSWCEVRIHTGRTHQIRVHAQHIGYPVAGDDKYGDAELNLRLRENTGLSRLALHAASLTFSLDNVEYMLSAPLPPELTLALDGLRNERASRSATVRPRPRR